MYVTTTFVPQSTPVLDKVSNRRIPITEYVAVASLLVYELTGVILDKAPTQPIVALALSTYGYEVRTCGLGYYICPKGTPNMPNKVSAPLKPAKNF